MLKKKKKPSSNQAQLFFFRKLNNEGNSLFNKCQILFRLRQTSIQFLRNQPQHFFSSFCKMHQSHVEGGQQLGGISFQRRIIENILQVFLYLKSKLYPNNQTMHCIPIFLQNLHAGFDAAGFFLPRRPANASIHLPFHYVWEEKHDLPLGLI